MSHLQLQDNNTMHQMEILEKFLQKVKASVNVRKVKSQIAKIYVFNDNILQIKGQNILQYFEQQKIQESTRRSSENCTLDIKGGPKRTESEWKWGEYRIFCWISIFWAFVQHNKVITNLDYHEIKIIFQLFSHKEQSFVEYHLLKLMKVSRMTKDEWSQTEIEMLQQIMKDNHYQEDWGVISYELFKKSKGQFFKAPDKSRQMWLNHLNPTVNKKQWTIQQDMLLFDLLNENGPKWSLISKKMNNSRNCHMVKNRFNSLIKKFKNQEMTFKQMTRKLISSHRYSKHIEATKSLEEIPPSESLEEIQEESVKGAEDLGSIEEQNKEYVEIVPKLTLDEDISYELYFQNDMQQMNADPNEYFSYEDSQFIKIRMPDQYQQISSFFNQ